MKPDAWISDILPTHVIRHKPDDGGGWYPVYSAATIRKWLEEVNETVIAAGTMHDTMDDLSDIGADAEGIYRAMIAAKLQEMEQEK